VCRTSKVNKKPRAPRQRAAASWVLYENVKIVLKTYGGRAKAHDGSCPISEANEAGFLENSRARESSNALRPHSFLISNQWLLGGKHFLKMYLP
jgi:hypothetical protein